MSISHNKKKNTALLFEFLTLEVSRSLVTGNEKRAKTAVKIIEKYFKQGTDLLREYRIARALISTKGINERVAERIIKDSCDAIKGFDVNEMNDVKRKIVRDIHYKLGDDVFDSTVSDYKIYATVHQLFEVWRKKQPIVESRDIKKKAELESVLFQWLIEEEKTCDVATDDSVLTERTSGVRRLVIKKMTEKLNKKYAHRLTEGQRKIVKSYALQRGSDEFKQQLMEVRDEAKSLAEVWMEENQGDETSQKLQDVVDLMEKEDYDNMDTDTVVRHMSYTSLVEEFLSQE